MAGGDPGSEALAAGGSAGAGGEEEAEQQRPTTVGLNCCAEILLLQPLRYVSVTSAKD